MNFVGKVLRVAKSRSSNQINIAHVREISPLIRNTGQNRPFQSIAELWIACTTAGLISNTRGESVSSESQQHPLYSQIKIWISGWASYISFFYILYTGSLGRWDKWLIDEASDVQSIIPSTQRPSVLYWRLSDFWSECQIWNSNLE